MASIMAWFAKPSYVYNKILLTHKDDWLDGRDSNPGWDVGIFFLHYLSHQTSQCGG